MRRWIFRVSIVGVLGLMMAYLATILYVIQGMSGNAVFPADCAIVFGTAVHQTEDRQGNITGTFAGPGIMRRVGAAADLYKEGKVKKVYLTGGRGEGVLRSEADVMREVAIQEGIRPRDITIEDKSTSTKENLLLTRPLTLGCSSIVAVSDPYHLARIGLRAWFMDWDVQTSPSQQEIQKVFVLKSWLREAIGIDLLVLEELLT